ncbi:hypothetical protein LZ012_11990 [Dechloromonas sp. XY25]|uniref:DUF4123 domain-containing protein n=1 Tax=Dechloromonas hankyongensis TaxID=2908002 RepID=A0ABS9K3E9_9RHOO|nr:hypothetical protein [Dechloromonas hankyongensis]MCG2577714.1 hypothetical protein [Dechloromonas hankyongensis]
MAFLNALVTQEFAPDALAAEVRTAVGKPLRRAAALTQLALIGACACLTTEQRRLPTILLWQSTSGPRQETLALLDEVCLGGGEPMPYDFLATQPALAAAQIQPFLPGLQSAMHLPLDSADSANWSLLLALAGRWLDQGRCAKVLCAQLDHWSDAASGQWLALGTLPLENTLARFQIGEVAGTASQPDTPDIPSRLSEWLTAGETPGFSLRSATNPRLAVEFARL